MSLGAVAGTVLTVTVSGYNEESTARQLQEYLEASYGENA
jgi:phosphotransferase system HPr-like phosphotransfer protein